MIDRTRKQCIPTSIVRLSAVLIMLLVASCNGSSNTPVDAGTGDTDTDADTDTDTDTGTAIDWGDTIPCYGDPEPGEVCVPGGKYMMGCVPGDVECDAEEGPMVEVTLSPFFVDVHEVTHDELIPWLNTLFDGYTRMGGRVYKEGSYGHLLWANRGAPVYKADEDGLYRWFGMYDELPTGITGDYTCFKRYSYSAAGGLAWWGAKLYCEQHGKQLPTEAQWEAAARGQTLNEYPCGTDIEPCWWGTYDCHQEGECAYENCFSPCAIPFHVDSPISGCWMTAPVPSTWKPRH